MGGWGAGVGDARLVESRKLVTGVSPGEKNYLLAGSFLSALLH